MIDESGPGEERRTVSESLFAFRRNFAKAEKINSPYTAQILRLTLLAPDIVKAILDGQWSAISN